MLYSCTHMATVGVKRLTYRFAFGIVPSRTMETIRCYSVL